MAEERVIKEYLLNSWTLNNPIIQDLPLEEIIKLGVKLQNSGVSMEYINAHPEHIENLGYLRGLNQIAKAHDFSLFSRDSLTGLSTIEGSLEKLEHLATTRDEYRLLAKALTHYEVIKAKVISDDEYINSETLEKSLIKEIKTLDEALELLKANEQWLQEEDGKEKGYFLHHVKKSLLARGDHDNITTVTQGIHKISKELRKENVNRESYFRNYGGLLSNTFSSIDEFVEGSKRIVQVMKEEDIGLSKRQEEYNYKFGIEYNQIFETLAKLPHLTRDIDSTIDTFRSLTRFSAKLERHHRKNLREYSSHDHMFDKSLYEMYCTLRDVGELFTSTKKVKQFLNLLDKIDRKLDSRERQYINLAFTLPCHNQDFVKVINTQAKVIKFAQLIEEAVDKNIYKSSLFGYTISSFSELTQNAPELERLAHTVFDLHQSYLDKETSKYDLEQLHYHVFHNFRPLFSSLQEVEENFGKLPKLIDYTKEHGFSERIGEDDYKKNLIPLIRVSKNLEEFENNAKAIVQMLEKTEETCESGKLISTLFPQLPESVNTFKDIKDNISIAQRYVQRWAQKEINPHCAFKEGFTQLSHLFKETPLETILETVDKCATSEKEKDLVGENFSFISKISWGGELKNRINSLEDYTTLFNITLEIIEGSKNSGLDCRDLDVGYNNDNDLEYGSFFDNIDICKDIMCAGLLPTKEILPIYIQTPKRQRAQFLVNIQEKKKEIEEKESFDPNDFTERYVMYNIAKAHPGSRVRTFENFTEICKKYVEGKLNYSDSDRSSDVIVILEKYSIVKPEK